MPRRRRRRRGRRINDKSAVERDMSDEDGTAPLNDEASCSPSSELFEDTAIFGSSDVNGKKKMLHQRNDGTKVGVRCMKSAKKRGYGFENGVEEAATRASASQKKRAEMHVETRSMRSGAVDIFAMEIPRRPRSKTNATIVPMADFNFQALPSMLENETLSKHPVHAWPSFIQKTHVKAPRKPKSDATPRRIVTPKNDPNGSLGILSTEPRTRRRRRQIIEDFEWSEDESGKDSPQAQKRARGRKSAHSLGDDSERVQSIRKIIQRCLRKPTPPNPIPSTSVRPPMPKPPPLIQKRNRREPPKDRLPSLERMETCPTVACLLKKGVIRLGDFVELLPLDSGLTICGWVTHRGILCSHCALVHSSKLFGACAGSLGTYGRLHLKDGRTLSRLLQTVND